MTRLVVGLAHLPALELSRLALVAEAARAGFASVGLRVHPATVGGSPPRAQILTAEGVRVSDIEFIQLTPDIDCQLRGTMRPGQHREKSPTGSTT